MAFEIIFILFGVFVLFLILACAKVIYQYERGVLFTLGKYSGTLEPGLRFVIPILQAYTSRDMRVRVIVVPPQDAITKDNVSVKVNVVLYFKIVDAAASVIKVNDFMYATSQLAQTTMRNVVGSITLDELLSQRESTSQKIMGIVEQMASSWGIKLHDVELKDIELPNDMKRVMAKAAEAERLKQAVIIRSEGDAAAAEKVTKAASIISSVNGALHLRTLQSLNDVASDPSNTVSFFIPFDVLKPYDGYGQEEKGKEKVKK
ncbi:MAG: slipin family protein [Candidatus Micrarchaeota archaeon]|nr:slipin family protein [Candidatus Micrarchaeota archaeon]